MDHPVAETNAVPPRGAVTVTVRGAAAAPAAPARREAAAGRIPRRANTALAQVLFVLGCAAAALAVFAMALPPAGSSILGSCAPTDEDAAVLRAASDLLLLSASAQVLAAAAALLAPGAPPVAFFAYATGWLTAYRAVDVVWMLVGCRVRARGGAFAFHFWFFFAVLLATLLVGLFTANR